MIQTVKLSYHTRKEQEKKSSMFDGFLKSSELMNVESEWVIKLFERLYGFTERVTKSFEEIDDCFYQTGDQVVRTDECFYQTGIQVVRTVGRSNGCKLFLSG